MFTTAAQLLDLTDSTPRPIHLHSFHESTDKLPPREAGISPTRWPQNDRRPPKLGSIRYDLYHPTHPPINTRSRLISVTANLVLQDTIERIFVKNLYSDRPRGIFLVRGENVLLLGEIVCFPNCPPILSEFLDLMLVVLLVWDVLMMILIGLVFLGSRQGRLYTAAV